VEGRRLRLDDELQRRLIAARNYAGLSQTEMGTLFGGLDKRRIIEFERGSPELRDFQLRNLVAGYADACKVPEAWFTADWSQLDTDNPVSSDELAQLRVALEELREQADCQAAEAKEREERLEQAMRAAVRELQEWAERIATQVESSKPRRAA